MYKCVKRYFIEKVDGNGFTLDGDFMEISEGSIWELPEEEEYRFIGGEVRLESDDGSWIEICTDILNEHFEKIE